MVHMHPRHEPYIIIQHIYTIYHFRIISLYSHLDQLDIRSTDLLNKTIETHIRTIYYISNYRYLYKVSICTCGMSRLTMPRFPECQSKTCLPMLWEPLRSILFEKPTPLASAVRCMRACHERSERTRLLTLCFDCFVIDTPMM